MTLQDLQKKYFNRIDRLDLDLIIAHVLKKNREFILTNPKQHLGFFQLIKIKSLISRRIKHEPLAYLTGHKEFYGLDFQVNRHTLIPRPETELLVENVLRLLGQNRQQKNSKHNQTNVSTYVSNSILIDIGTGSGNIIMATAKNLKKSKIQYLAIDQSRQALKIARKNAHQHQVDQKIKFLQGDLLKPFIKKYSSQIENLSSIIIAANLPYLSQEILQSASVDVKKFEPESALLSPQKGLGHYEKLFNQIQKIHLNNPKLPITVLIEYSPEQKQDLQEMIKKILPESQSDFQKDLSGLWRIAQINL